jgi:hypothetical protein
MDDISDIRSMYNAAWESEDLFITWVVREDRPGTCYM